MPVPPSITSVPGCQAAAELARPCTDRLTGRLHARLAKAPILPFFTARENGKMEWLAEAGKPMKAVAESVRALKPPAWAK